MATKKKSNQTRKPKRQKSRLDLVLDNIGKTVSKLWELDDDIHDAIHKLLDLVDDASDLLEEEMDDDADTR